MLGYLSVVLTPFSEVSVAEPEGPKAGSEASEPMAPESPAPERPRIVDAVIDLLQTTVDWLRQEVEDTVREKVALPMQKVGIAIGSALAAGCLTAVGLIFIAIALLLVLAQLLTWPGALALIGVVYLIGGAVFLVIKSRSMVR